MASWRDLASSQVQHDLDSLLDPALGFVQQQMDKHGEFFPYAVVICTGGQIEMVAARPGSTNDSPRSTDAIIACRTTLAEGRDHLRAAAVVADVRLPDGRDAIRVELEHTDGPALTVVLPYAKKRLGRGIAYEPLQAGPGIRHVWSD